MIWALDRSKSLQDDGLDLMHLAVREAISEVSMHPPDIAVPTDMEAFSRGRNGSFGMPSASIRDFRSYPLEVNRSTSLKTYNVGCIVPTDRSRKPRGDKCYMTVRSESLTRIGGISAVVLYARSLMPTRCCQPFLDMS